MRIHGFNKLTLLDYPGKVGCTVFVGNCNFRCPFCHNAGLVISPENEPVLDEEEVLSVLKKRQGILEGVCITGGEPTLSGDLGEFLVKIKRLDYPIKLDTNGYKPQTLKELTEEKLIDYVAMDIKNSRQKYALTTGVSQIDISRIEESVSYLMKSSLEYEFRTTVTRELHQISDFVAIGEWLKGCSRYFLQAYRETETVISPVFSGYSQNELQHFADLLREWIPTVDIRGAD
ncbi:anaerobic ribonucleoside-triphosphate reductase activating protein [Ruminococcus sp. OA3]|uniref:anaerobic ribonucleoside-triphosphate reductase activating protein n=1 Tax=Ruminococcus sp. OA3 TaxID=2914164 RepID=UPI001F05422D|nr:anaerobic ribonucleoside-triphosphate reductase activating protein [Ruminococcus sp. OA3]MCH1984422.1 anaerobic ribonucleoside-triphosphate reductase activating protein [Ruminococcus sp. OA3]